MVSTHTLNPLSANNEPNAPKTCKYFEVLGLPSVCVSEYMSCLINLATVAEYFVLKVKSLLFIYFLVSLNDLIRKATKLSEKKAKSHP